MATPPNVTVTLTAEDRGVSRAIQDLTLQLQTLAVEQKNVAASANEASLAEEGMGESMREAKGAAALLGEEVGIKLNRHLRGVLAQSEVLGPALAAAFPIAAAIGFAEVIVHATEKLTEWISDTFIFTEAMKEMTKTIVIENAELDRLATAHANALREQELAGKSALEQAKLRKTWTDEAAESTKKDAEAIEARRKALEAEIKTLQNRKAEEQAKPSAFVAPESIPMEAPEIGVIEEQIKKAQEQLEKLPVSQLGAARQQAATDNAIAAQQKVTEARSEAEAKEAADREKRLKETIAAIEKMRKEEEQLATERKTLAEETSQFWGKQEEKITVSQSKEIDKRIEAESKFRDESMRSEEQRAVDAITLQERNVEQLARRGDIRGADEAARLQALADEKLQIETNYFNERLKVLQDRRDDEGNIRADDLAEFSKLLAQKRAAEDQYLAASQKAKQIAADADPLRNIEKTIGRDLENFFTRGITQAQSFGDAMRGLAQSVIASLQQMAAQFLLTKLSKDLLEESSAPAGSTSGGGFLGFLSGIFGAAAGHATGGLIEGPGGPAADIIPAMLSSGEFVMTADAVRALGVSNLEAMNKAAKTPAIAGASAAHFAEGGFAGGDVSTSSEISMGIGLDEGLILRHLGSKAAGKVILQQLTNNPKGAQRALSRTD